LLCGVRTFLGTFVTRWSGRLFSG